MEKFKMLVPNAMPVPEHIPAWPMQSFTITSCNAGIMTLPNQQEGLMNLAS